MSIEVFGLSKRYGDILALDDISFQVEKGELFGFLGPNGAGKTTTISILTGLARPDKGTIYINGLECTNNLKGAQQLMGVVPDENNLYPELTGFENLCFCAALYGLRNDLRRKRARDLLKMFGLTEACDRKFAFYSKGMKRKLTLAAGIIHQPSILFLDEPTTGIDVASARRIRQIIADLQHEGTTVFLTTHYIEEAERLCERIAFIVDGRIVRIDRVGDLLRPVQDKNILLLSTLDVGIDLWREIALEFPQYHFQADASGQVRIESTEPINIGPLVRSLDEKGIQVVEARRHYPSLEDIFVQVTGIGLGVMKREKERGGVGGGQ